MTDSNNYRLYWGNSNANAYQNSGLVYTVNKAVYHMNQPDVIDVTGNGYNGSTSGPSVPNVVNGILGHL